MATVNFSVPNDVKNEFNKLFADENKSAILADLMRQAIEERKRARRRAAAVEKILALHKTAPPATKAEIEKARQALRK